MSNSDSKIANSTTSYLGDKTNTKIKYDNVLTTCENIRNNVIVDLKNILDDYNDIYNRRSSIWSGMAGDKYFVEYKSDLNRYEQYLTQYSLENYVKSVENLVANNKGVDKGISSDEIARINQLIPIVQSVSFDPTFVGKSSDNETGHEAINGVLASVDSGNAEGQKKTFVEAKDVIHSSVIKDVFDGQKDTTAVGATNNIKQTLNTDTVDGQEDTSMVGSINNIKDTLNSDTVEGQTDTASFVQSTNQVAQSLDSNIARGQSNTAAKVQSEQTLNSNIVSDNSKITESQQSLINDIFNMSGGGE